MKPETGRKLQAIGCGMTATGCLILIGLPIIFILIALMLAALGIG